MRSKHYPDDLTENEWLLLERYVKLNYAKGGRKPKHSKREYLDAIFYWLRTGCGWRHLPHDFPPWKSVYTQFRRWRLQDIFQKIEDNLRVRLRKSLGRKPKPSAGIVDSQSIKTTERGGLKGYDGTKKIKGRKRHIVTDTEGLLLCNVVTAANENDRQGIKQLFDKLKASGHTLKKMWADMGYQGQETKALAKNYGIDLEIVRRPSPWFRVSEEITDIPSYLLERGYDLTNGFKVLPRRWVVERTLAWLNKYRRISKDYEYLIESSEVTLLLAMIRTMLKRLMKMSVKEV